MATDVPTKGEENNLSSNSVEAGDGAITAQIFKTKQKTDYYSIMNAILVCVFKRGISEPILASPALSKASH